MNPAISPELSLITNWKSLEKCPWCTYRPNVQPRNLQGSINAHVKSKAQKQNNGHPDATDDKYRYFAQKRGMFEQSHDPEVQREKRQNSKKRAYDRLRERKENEKLLRTQEWHQVNIVGEEIENLKYLVLNAAH